MPSVIARTAIVNVMGSASLVQALLAHDLVDEMNLMIEPIVLGGGKNIFPGNGEPLKWELVSSTAANTGVPVPATSERVDPGGASRRRARPLTEWLELSGIKGRSGATYPLISRYWLVEATALTGSRQHQDNGTAAMGSARSYVRSVDQTGHGGAGSVSRSSSARSTRSRRRATACRHACRRISSGRKIPSGSSGGNWTAKSESGVDITTKFGLHTRGIVLKNLA